MLRRAAPLVRTLRSATTVTHSSTAASSGDNVIRRKGREGEKEGVRASIQRKDLKRDFKPRYSDSIETTQLMRKHQDTIESTGLVSLNDAIERVNWYATVNGSTLEKVSDIVIKSTIEELNSMSDRSMASILSSFGEACKEKSRVDKRKLLETTLKEITEKGYSLGPLSRVSVFTARVDLAETVADLPSVVDELSTWESTGYSLNEDMVVQAARVYAMQGDRKGVIELTNYARESFGRVEVRFLEWLSFSMISCGEGSGMAAIEKLSRSSPDCAARLWLSAAHAAATRADLTTTVECLSRVPLAAMLQHSDYNVPVVDILVHLIERRVEGAEKALSSYLSLSGDGVSLHERHGANSTVVFKARRATNEGKIDVATRLYTLCHETQRHKVVGLEMKNALGELASKGERGERGEGGESSMRTIEEMRKCATRLQECHIIDNANSFLLSQLRGEKLVEMVTILRRSGDLSDAVKTSRAGKFFLAIQLIKSLSSCGLSPLSVAPSVAALFFSTPLTSEQRDDAHKFIFRAANNDADVVVRALDELSHSNMPDSETLAGHLANSCLSMILMENDILSSGRIDTLIQSKSIPMIRLVSMESKLVRLLVRAKDEDSMKRAVDIVAGVIIAAFRSGGRDDWKSLGLIKFIGNTGITDQQVEKIVNAVTSDPCVGISEMEMGKARKELEKRGLKKRADLLGLLKKKSQASQRWYASSIDDLENELNSLEGKKDVKDIVLVSIRTIILEKLDSITPVAKDRVINILERFIPTLEMKNETVNKKDEKTDPWESARRIRMREWIQKIYGKTMRESVMEGEWSTVERLWRARGSVRSLPVAPSLALAYHKRKGGGEEVSREIIGEILSKGLSVGAADLYDLGELFHNLSMDELNEVGEFLKKELRLETNDVERIKNASVKRNIREMINSGNLEKAFGLMKESSEKSKNAIGHFEVMRAAIREDNRVLLESTVNTVSSLHSKATAILDLGFSFLLENRGKYAEQLFKNPSLKLSYAKISFFIKYAREENRIDVVHSLFSILVSCPLSDEKLSLSDINYVAFSALSSYVNNKEVESAKKLVKEIEESTLVVVDSKLKDLINRVKNSSRSSTV